MPKRLLISLTILSLILMVINTASLTHAAPTFTVTVSGTISGPSGVLNNVWVGIGSESDWQETTTNPSGYYSISLETDGGLGINVRPDHATRLAQTNVHEQVTGDLTRDFNLQNGNLLELTVIGEGGIPYDSRLGYDILPLFDPLSDNEWYWFDWDGGLRMYSAVLPPDVYYISIVEPPDGYFHTSQNYDLRSGDLSDSLTLNTSFVHPIPYDPPDASKISIGPVDNLGEAVISGAAGAALPFSNVLLVNLSSSHQGHAFSEADGSFSTSLYAPPGSAVMIKHGPPDHRWRDLEVGLADGVNPFPGTILHVPLTGSEPMRPDSDLAWAAAGAIDGMTDDSSGTLNYVGSAWAASGTLGPVVIEGEWTRVISGTYQSQSVPGLYLGGLNWTHPALGDLDGNGTPELLVGERGGHLILYRNHGSASAPDWRFETGEFGGIYTDGLVHPALADVTDDGATDLFVGSGNGPVSIYYNNNGITGTPDVVLGAGENAAPALDDLDDDGDLDLLVGHSGGTLYHFRNDGTLEDPLWALQTSSYAGISEPDSIQPAFVDLDQDGDRDLMLGMCGSYIWYARGGPASAPTWTRMVTDPLGFGGGSCAISAGVGDWDDNGLDDVVTGEHWGVLRFFHNNAPSGWAEDYSYEFPFDLNGETAPALSDWDDDGDLDMLLGQVHGDLRQYTNIGSASAPDWRDDGALLTLPWTNHPHPFPAFVDIDNDNDDDLFVGVGDWDGPEAGGNIHYYQNQGTHESPNWVLQTENFLGLDVGGWSTPVFTDIDNDDDMDLFVGDLYGTLTFVENTGSASSAIWATPVGDYASLDLGDYSAPSFFDLDQDTDLDMLVGLEHGSLAYVRNTGDANNPDWELVTTMHPNINVGGRATPTSGDLNGDSSPDLLIGDIDGGLNLYHYDGPGTPPVGDSYAPGDLINVSGELSLYSPAIDAGTDVGAIQASGQPHLMRLFDQNGNPLAAQNYFMSTVLTPTGFPIQSTPRANLHLDGSLQVEDLAYLGGNKIGGTFNLTFQIPADTQPGAYRPIIEWQIVDAPSNTDWLAANVTRMTYQSHEAPLPLITIGTASEPHLVWRLMMDDFTLGTRGAGAVEDENHFGLASQIVTQGALQIIPPVDEHDGAPITYRMEPFLPMISFTDRRMPTPPLIPFELPGGQLCASIEKPDGTIQDLGCGTFAQSFNRTKTTRGGIDLNNGTVQMEDVYSLKATSDQFLVTFDQHGHYTATLTGGLEDTWGNTYNGGGEYHFLVAHPLDFDPGVLPGTPLAAGKAINPAVQINPGLPADVTIQVTHYPDSNPDLVQTFTRHGKANNYGYFSVEDDPILLTDAGEYRIDMTAVYEALDGSLYAGTQTWGGVVMTPSNQAQLIAHGRRGLDSLEYIPNHWFVNSRDLIIPEGAISHSLNPYYNGDIYWSRLSDYQVGGDSLIMGASVQDTVGVIEAVVLARTNREGPGWSPPGDLSERFDKNEIPLFISNYSDKPPHYFLGKIGSDLPEDVDQIAYSYRYSERPGVRVREVIAEESQSGGYWRLDTLYDDQFGVGILGDVTNDFKFQYVGAVYRDLENDQSEYLGQGSGWIFIPEDDPMGSRAMPPYSGPGNGGWTTDGGPLLILKGEDIHMFILPTGVRPGAVLETGDTFHFAGHLMPTLDSQVAVTVTAPSGAHYLVDGQANSIGYFYDPLDDFVVDEPGLWAVDVQVWHDGQCSGGATIPPYPSGDVLGSENGRYYFYVTPQGAKPVTFTSPSEGYLSFPEGLEPVSVEGVVPNGLSQPSVHYTIRMPGYILEQGELTPTNGSFEILYDPVALQSDFPNLDLIGRDRHQDGLADTVTIDVLLQGQRSGVDDYHAATITLQGERVYLPVHEYSVHLPLVVR